MVQQIGVDDAKRLVLEAVAKGATVESAMGAVGRVVRTWESWRRNDPEFARRADEIRALRKNRKGADVSVDIGVPGSRDLDFVEWRREFLGFETYPHQQQWIDVLEGREPTPLEGCEWDGRDPRRLIVNVPPGHSKTQTITADYLTYRICMDPNVRIIIISKRVEQAQKNLYQIQQRLTSTRFAKLQAAYAPDGGFKPAKGEGAYTQRVMYVAGRTADHKDPTVEALGLGSQIYGSRADIIVLDDAVVLSNANEFEKQIQWLESEVESRVKNGMILLVGTRLASQDLYAELRNDDRYMSGRSPWSYLRQPMVLRFAEDPKDWVTLWPKSNVPFDALDEAGADGLYTMWDGARAAKMRDSKPPAVWSLVYQQMQVSEDSVFKPACVLGSVDGRRKPGRLTAGAWGHPRHGKEGMWTIGAMDPGMGVTFAVVGCADRVSGKRFIENAYQLTNPTPAQIRDLIKNVTLEFGVNEWVIEEQGFQGFLVHDTELRAWLATRGVAMSGHYTGKNKVDPEFGVASLAPLFGSTRRINEGAGREVHNDDNLLTLPDQNMSPGVKALIEQLITWVPGKRGSKLTQDGPMALWFWETRARVFLGVDRGGSEQKFVQLPFMSRGQKSQQVSAPFAWGSRRVVGGG